MPLITCTYQTVIYETGLQDFLQRIKATPSVVNASNFRHNITNREGGTYDISWPGKDPNARIDFTDLAVGYDYIETAHLALVAGRSYSRNYGNEKSNIVLNETAIRTMGMKNPIGKSIRLWGNDRTIIGVVKDFNFQSLHEQIKPCFLDLTVNQWASKIMVRIQTTNQAATINRLGQLYREYNDGQTFDYRFLDDDYQALYSAEIRIASLSKYFAGIAIIISCLGLLGLATFTAQKRQKEMSIRKVTGASTGQILVLLSKNFLLLAVLSLSIAVPVAWWLMTRWLNGFAYHIHPGIGTFAITIVGTPMLTALSISFQSIRAAWTNPVKHLRSE